MPSAEENVRGKRAGFWKFAVRFSAIIIVAFLLIWGFGEYRQYEGRKKLDRFVEETERLQREEYDRAMADTYGGKTPQETLGMYIEAVEVGDYELASKYFIFDRQVAEFEKLENSPRQNTEKILVLLKQSLTSEGSFSNDQSGYLIRKPILVDFKLYPNGIWKIIEI